MTTRFAVRALARTGLGRIIGAMAPWSGVLGLNYHRVGEANGSLFDHGLWSASAEAFDRQVRFLKQHTDIVGPGDLPRVRRKGRGRFVILTFDDGYRDNYDLAFPILRSHGVPATFFLTTGFLDRRELAWWDEIAWMVRSSQKPGIDAGRWFTSPVAFDEPAREAAVRIVLRTYKNLPGDETTAYLDDLGVATGSGRWRSPADSATWMTWDMAREMRAAGMVIGGHTVNHPVLAHLSPEQQWVEIDGCRRRLLEELGEPMLYFSYPVGSRQAFDGDTRHLLMRAGVQCAFSYYGGLQRLDHVDDFDLPRIPIESFMDRDWFQAVVTLPMVFGREQ